MKHPVDTSVISTILLDLGGVLLDIRSNEEWKNRYINPLLGREIDQEDFRRLYIANELGELGPDRLKKELEALAGKPLSTAAFEAAWNGILLDMPERNMDAVRSLSEKFTLYLLSNTNSIHKDAWWRIIHDRYGEDAFPSAFSGYFYSHEIGSIKPDREIFSVVHKGIGQPAKSSVLFFDDKEENVEAARSFGWQSVRVIPGSADLTDLAGELGLL